MNDSVRHRVDSVRESFDEVKDAVEHRIEELKPRLRGWLHLGSVPMVLAAGIVLIALSPTTTTRIGSTVFTVSALVLFGVSAIYHRGTWSPRTWAFLRRFDHSNIFLLIAGSYTPFSLIMLEGADRVWMLSIVWGGAVAGVAFRIFWTDAPRWLYTPIYIALGWAAVPFIDDFAAGVDKVGLGIGIATLVLVAVGGVLYTLGGVVYGLKRPNPWPRTFGFHEVFHSFTVLAFTAHYVGISLATYSLR